MPDEANKQKAPRKPKAASHVKVGSWNEARTVFTLSAKQPPEGMTDINDVYRWVKDNYASAPGAYEFIRTIAGKQVLAKQEVLNSSWLE